MTRHDSEKKRENNSAAVAKAHGWYTRKRTTPGRRGAFDRLYIKAGRVIFAEYKLPGVELDPLQVEEKEELDAAGAENYVLHSVDETKAVLGIV
jgi:hypothetical protein